MGYATTLDFRREFGDDIALEHHFSNGHIEPIHPVFIPVAKEAIQRARFEEWGDQLVLPNERVLTVADIIRQLHLEAFLPDLSEGC